MHMNKLLPLIVLALLPLTSQAYMAMSDDQVRQLIMQGSITDYTKRYGTNACPCPYSVGRSGHACGLDSGYYQGEGAVALRCYPRDITQDEVDQYRIDFGIPTRDVN